MKAVAITLLLAVALGALGTLTGGALGYILIPVLGDGGAHGAADLAIPLLGALFGGVGGVLAGIGLGIWLARAAPRPR